jgi:hypothetical protein
MRVLYLDSSDIKLTGSELCRLRFDSLRGQNVYLFLFLISKLSSGIICIGDFV